jgi:hypothetical protein
MASSATYSDGDLFRKRVQMQDTRVSRSDNVFGIDNGELGLELRGDSNRLDRRCQHETGGDIFIVDTLQPYPDVVTAVGDGQFLALFVVYASDFDGGL